MQYQRRRFCSVGAQAAIIVVSFFFMFVRRGKVWGLKCLGTLSQFKWGVVMVIVVAEKQLVSLSKCETSSYWLKPIHPDSFWNVCTV